MPPARHQTSAHGDKLMLAVALRERHRSDRLGRRYSARLVIPGRLVQRESIETDHFFPLQLLGEAPTHPKIWRFDRQHVVIFRDDANHRPSNWAKATSMKRDPGPRPTRLATYSEQHRGYGCAAKAVRRK